METEILEKKSWNKDEVENIKSELSDKHLRLYAEFENYKRRVAKEKEDIRNLTKLETLSAVLDVDNELSIAVNKIEADSHQKSFRDGLLLILSKLDKFLQSQGIESIQSETYDENIHEVVSIMPYPTPPGGGSYGTNIYAIDGWEPGKIMEVVSKGYTLNGNVIRYPKVILAK